MHSHGEFSCSEFAVTVPVGVLQALFLSLNMLVCVTMFVGRDKVTSYTA